MALLSAFLLLVLAVPAAHAGTIAVGDVAPAFVLPDRAGRPVSLAARRGKLVCVDFWASWCAHCRRALPALDALARRHAGELEVLAIGIDRERAPGERFLSTTLPEPTLTVLYDHEGEVMRRFGPSGMPSLYVIDAGGVVRLVAGGYEPAALPEIERAVERLLPAAARP